MLPNKIPMTSAFRVSFYQADPSGSNNNFIHASNTSRSGFFFSFLSMTRCTLEPYVRYVQGVPMNLRSGALLSVFTICNIPRLIPGVVDSGRQSGQLYTMDLLATAVPKIRD